MVKSSKSSLLAGQVNHDQIFQQLVYMYYWLCTIMVAINFEDIIVAKWFTKKSDHSMTVLLVCSLLYTLQHLRRQFGG